MLRTLRRLLLWLFAVALWSLPCAHAQNIPPIACPNYFQYQGYDNVYIGYLTLPNLSMGTTQVIVQFSQREPVYSSYYGSLSLYSDEQTTINQLSQGKSISYRIDFPLPDVLPKLTNINVNGVVICSASEYPAPSTVFKLEHKFQTTTFPGRGPGPGRFPSPGPIRGPDPVQNPPTIHTMPKINVVTPKPNIDATCGIENKTPVSTPLIVGGKVLTRGQFPWLTAIFKKETSSAGLTFICGGSLISARTVVTAAHCFKHPAELTADKIVLYLGRHNLNDYDEKFELRGVQKLLPHHEYNSVKFSDADIALIQMSTNVIYTEFIKPICLWSEPTNYEINEVNAFVAGWGADESRTVSNLPKVVDTVIVSESECLRSNELNIHLTSNRTICAGKLDGTGPCMGDSGGGLMIQRDGRWMIRGIVSAGQTVQQKCNLEAYVIYCDLSKHMEWVLENMLG